MNIADWLLILDSSLIRLELIIDSVLHIRCKSKHNSSERILSNQFRLLLTVLHDIDMQISIGCEKGIDIIDYTGRYKRLHRCLYNSIDNNIIGETHRYDYAMKRAVNYYRAANNLYLSLNDNSNNISEHNIIISEYHIVLEKRDIIEAFLHADTLLHTSLIPNRGMINEIWECDKYLQRSITRLIHYGNIDISFRDIEWHHPISQWWWWIR